MRFIDIFKDIRPKSNDFVKKINDLEFHVKLVDAMYGTEVNHKRLIIKENINLEKENIKLKAESRKLRKENKKLVKLLDIK